MTEPRLGASLRTVFSACKADVCGSRTSVTDPKEPLPSTGDVLPLAAAALAGFIGGTPVAARAGWLGYIRDPCWVRRVEPSAQLKPFFPKSAPKKIAVNPKRCP